MKILIAEDDFASRKFMFKLLSQYGECDMTVDGIEAVEAFVMAYEAGEPYQLLCLDIMMPRIDGLKTLETIRDFENKMDIGESQKCKVIFVSAINKTEVPEETLKTLGSGIFLTKPVGAGNVKEALNKLGITD